MGHSIATWKAHDQLDIPTDSRTLQRLLVESKRVARVLSWQKDSIVAINASDDGCTTLLMTQVSRGTFETLTDQLVESLTMIAHRVVRDSKVKDWARR
jgi:molecular chaperone DnaK (HSP70)